MVLGENYEIWNVSVVTDIREYVSDQARPQGSRTKELGNEWRSRFAMTDSGWTPRLFSERTWSWNLIQSDSISRFRKISTWALKHQG